MTDSNTPPSPPLPGAMSEARSHATKAENVLKPDPFAGVLGEFAGGYASARRDLGKAVRDMADVALSQPAKTEGAEG